MTAVVPAPPLNRRPRSRIRQQTSALWIAAGCAFTLGRGTAAILPQNGAGVRGAEIIARVIETNRYWLAGPPKQIQRFSYTLHRLSGNQEFQVSNPSQTPRARLQGVTWSGMLQHLARAPQSATVLSVAEESGRVRLTLRFEPALRGAVGNGVENSWNGYHTFGGAEGVLVIDVARWIPIESQIGRLREVFGEFVPVDSGHLAPLKVRIEVGDSVYDWRFRVYDPGLWLFDDSFSDGRRLAWVEKVTVNSAPGKVVRATDSSMALAAAVHAGSEWVARFLEVNRHWLAPSLESRRGLVYEYRQEHPYLERVIIDPAGNVLVRLESSKESPGIPTRAQLLLADGRSFSGPLTNTLIRLTPAPKPEKGRNAAQRDGLAQHLAMGLALECALTRLAREPDSFWADAQPVRKQPNRYLLVLRPKRDARLFTGTMLAFTSWAYMHDVRYDRSEILCDATTHRPVEEKDYAGQDELKGHYVFQNWLEAASGAAPGVIRAVVPHHKDGRDESLEMEAEFCFPRPGLWLLNEVKSRFRGGSGGSIGSVRLLAPTESDYSEVRDLLARTEATERLLEVLESAPDGGAEVHIAMGGWVPALLKASWSEEARKSSLERESSRDDTAGPQPLIAVYRARLVESASDSITVELEGLSTASWKEFRSRWDIYLQDDQGRTVATGTANTHIRAENGPTPFVIRVAASLATTAPSSQPARLRIQGNVERMTGAYHGHGRWMKFVDR